MDIDADILRRSDEFAIGRAMILNGRLGFGKDGIVWKTARSTAVKVFRRADLYHRELAVYQRLKTHCVIDVAGHSVPQLRRFDEVFLAIEMTIVSRPFLLDFASAYLDGTAPVFPDDVMAEWLEDKKEQFGANWPKAASVLAGLRKYGIQMTDIHPGNIGFAPT